jgi:hypothetical protein
VIWGIWHGLFNCIEKILFDLNKKRSLKVNNGFNNERNLEFNGSFNSKRNLEFNNIEINNDLNNKRNLKINNGLNSKRSIEVNGSFNNENDSGNNNSNNNSNSSNNSNNDTNNTNNSNVSNDNKLDNNKLDSDKLDSNKLNLISNGLQHIYCLLVVIIGWVIFRSPSLQYSIDYIKNMFGLLQDAKAWYPTDYYLNRLSLTAFAFALLCMFPIFKNWKESDNVLINLFLILLLVMSLVFMSANTYHGFLYFQF